MDYLCINSQYTNAGYGLQPEVTLAGGAGNVKSLGNFGGYITYYFADALTDNPNNPYGVDFYVYGNSQADGGSLGGERPSLGLRGRGELVRPGGKRTL